MGAGEKGTLEQGEIQGVHGPLASNDDAEWTSVSPLRGTRIYLNLGWETPQNEGL